jgi:hypothetical protein
LNSLGFLAELLGLSGQNLWRAVQRFT